MPIRHGEPGLHLSTRPLLSQYDGTALILANDVERVLADIDADYGGDVSSFCDMACSLSSVPPASIRCWQGGSTAGPFHSRTSPLLRLSARRPNRSSRRNSCESCEPLVTGIVSATELRRTPW